MTTNDARNLQRYPLWHEQRERFETLLQILTVYDPIGICFPDNPHREIEYSLEVNTILPRLNEAATVEDVHRIVDEEFVRWFGRSIRDTERYDLIAADIWQIIGPSRDNTCG